MRPSVSHHRNRAKGSGRESTTSRPNPFECWKPLPLLLLLPARGGAMALPSSRQAKKVRAMSSRAPNQSSRRGSCRPAGRDGSTKRLQ